MRFCKKYPKWLHNVGKTLTRLTQYVEFRCNLLKTPPYLDIRCPNRGFFHY